MQCALVMLTFRCRDKLFHKQHHQKMTKKCGRRLKSPTCSNHCHHLHHHPVCKEHANSQQSQKRPQALQRSTTRVWISHALVHACTSCAHTHSHSHSPNATLLHFCLHSRTRLKPVHQYATKTHTFTPHIRADDQGGTIFMVQTARANEDPCHREACDIQTCLQRNNYRYWFSPISLSSVCLFFFVTAIFAYSSSFLSCLLFIPSPSIPPLSALLSSLFSSQ